MKLLIDAHTIQSRLQQKRNRLQFLIDKLKSSFRRPEIVIDNIMDGIARLDPPDVIMVPTRIFPAVKNETQAIEKVVKEQGKGLFILSNHAPSNQKDNSISERFGVSIENTSFEDGHTKLFEDDGIDDFIKLEQLNEDHPIVTGESPENKVRELFVNNCSSIQKKIERRLVDIPAQLKDQLDTPGSGRCFAVAVDSNDFTGKGRVVVASDSGFLGDSREQYQFEDYGRGLIQKGHNMQFVKNSIRWLSGKI